MAEAEPPSHGEPRSGTVVLSSTRDEVSLTQYGAIAGTLRVNLRWNQSATGGGHRGLFGARRSDAPNLDSNHGIDLDLGCLYQFTDGQRGVVQAVGRRNGDYARAPFIRLDRDDRMGSSTGQNIYINMDQSAHFQRILVFVMVTGGTEDLTRVGATVTIYPTSGPALEIRVEGSPTAPTRARSCAVVQILRQGPEIVVHRELRYFSGYQSEIDRAYNWGMHWGPGPGKNRLETRGARTRALRRTREISIVIYMADETVHEIVEAALESLLEDAGFEIIHRGEPLVGSFFRKSRAVEHSNENSSVLREAIRTAAHVADSRIVHTQDANVTATLMAGLGPLIAALQPTKDAAVRVGALLLVKVDWAVGVHQLTVAQQLKLDHNPQLVASPKELIEVLCLPPLAE